MLHVHVHIQVREDVSTDSLQVLGFVMIRYSDHEVQRKVQSMKHTIKNHEVDIKFQRVCGLMYIIVYIIYRVSVFSSSLTMPKLSFF